MFFIFSFGKSAVPVSRQGKKRRKALRHKQQSGTGLLSQRTKYCPAGQLLPFLKGIAVTNPVLHYLFEQYRLAIDAYNVHRVN